MSLYQELELFDKAKRECKEMERRLYIQEENLKKTLHNIVIKTNTNLVVVNAKYDDLLKEETREIVYPEIYLQDKFKILKQEFIYFPEEYESKIFYEFFIEEIESGEIININAEAEPTAIVSKKEENGSIRYYIVSTEIANSKHFLKNTYFKNKEIKKYYAMVQIDYKITAGEYTCKFSHDHRNLFGYLSRYKNIYNI